jgi:hypothetical protein
MAQSWVYYGIQEAVLTVIKSRDEDTLIIHILGRTIIDATITPTSISITLGSK